MGGLLNINDLWKNKPQNMPDYDCNKALAPGTYVVDGKSKNIPSGFYSYGLLIVFGVNIPPYRISQLIITSKGELACRAEVISSTVGPISEFTAEWSIK